MTEAAPIRYSEAVHPAWEATMHLCKHSLVLWVLAISHTRKASDCYIKKKRIKSRESQSRVPY